MARIRFLLKNGTRLERKLSRLSRGMQGQVLSNASLVGAQVIVSEAKRIVPVGETGVLRGSITSVPAETSPHRATSHVGYGKEAPYGKYIELGTGIYAEGGKGRKTPWVYFKDSPSGGRFYWTKGAAAQPFLRPALVQGRVKAKAQIGAALKRQLDQLGAGV